MPSNRTRDHRQAPGFLTIARIRVFGHGALSAPRFVGPSCPERLARSAIAPGTEWLAARGGTPSPAPRPNEPLPKCLYRLIDSVIAPVSNRRSPIRNRHWPIRNLPLAARLLPFPSGSRVVSSVIPSRLAFDPTLARIRLYASGGSATRRNTIPAAASCDEVASAPAFLTAITIRNRSAPSKIVSMWYRVVRPDALDTIQSHSTRSDATRRASPVDSPPR